MATPTAPPDVINVIVALAASLVLLSDVAVSVTVEFVGTAAGAVYVTAVLEALESVPHVGAQLLPDWVSAQDTPKLDGSLATVAVNCCIADRFSAALVGDMVTEIDAVTVIVAVAFFVASETEVAVKLTVAGLGMLAGAE